MEFNCPYWSMTTKITMLEDWILVHSCLHYEKDISVVTDFKFASNAMQLVRMIEQNPKDFAKSEYAYVFNDFDGSTGYDLYSRLNAKHKKKIEERCLAIQNLIRNGKVRKL